MKQIQLFDLKTRTLGFAFCQPPKKSLPKSLTQKKSLQNFKPKKSPQIGNFKPKKGLRTSPSLMYLSTPPPPPWAAKPHENERRASRGMGKRSRRWFTRLLSVQRSRFALAFNFRDRIQFPPSLPFVRRPRRLLLIPLPEIFFLTPNSR